MKCNEAIKKLNKFNLFTIASSTLLSTVSVSSVIAGSLPEQVLWGNPTCDVNTSDILRKHELRKAALVVTPNNPNTQAQYQAIIQKHKSELQACRDRTAPQTQATWIRLYPNDAKAGVLEDVFDKVANRGYNQVFIETFYDGRVLLPVADNPTPWKSVMEEAVKAGEVPADYDLWKQAIAIGRARGIKVYGWSFTMNFGYGYSEIKGRSGAVALNGNGENSIANTNFDRNQVANGKAFYEDAYEADHLFADPYSAIAKADLTSVVKALIQRNPDGMVFDYVRYPTNSTGALIDNVKQLWIHGQSSRTALLNSIDNKNVRELMSLYLQNGDLTSNDVIQTEKRLAETAKVKPTNLKIGTVFFPNGNRSESGKFEARMQPWDRFPSNMERHPMTYALCNDGNCVADQVTEVVRQSPPETLVCPVLAGTWGQGFDGHPSFEKQMQAIRAREPKINCFSHFVYAWMEPESDRLRKVGKATGLENPTLPN